MATVLVLQFVGNWYVEGLTEELAVDISARAPAPDPVNEERALLRHVASGQPEILQDWAPNPRAACIAGDSARVAARAQLPR